jgi:DNA recombination protein RmuC
MDVLSLLLLLLILVLVVFTLWRKAPPATGLHELAEAVTNVRLTLTGLVENVRSVEHSQRQVDQGLAAVGNGVTKAESEIRAIVHRVQQLENVQQHANQRMTTLQLGLAQADVLTRSLAETAETIRAQVVHTNRDLASLQTLVKARQVTDLQTAEAVKRLEAILAGTQTRGAAGENILEQVFAKLPLEWQVRDFRVGDKYVEFGVRLPNNLVVPIDSKWTATGLLEQFLRSHDVQEQRRLKTEINRVVLNKAREVCKYIDPSRTMPFGIAALPDAIYDLCSECHVEAFQMNVVLVGYSMFVPYLLLVFQTVLKTGNAIELQRLTGYLQSLEKSVQSLQEELEGRFSRALTMLGNARDDMRLHLSKAAMGLTSLRSHSGELPALPHPEAESTQC